LAGMQYLGDDYVLMDADLEPRVYSLYASAKLCDEQLPRLRALAAQVANPDKEEGEKSLIFPHNAYAEQVRREAPLRALVLPRVVRQTVSRLQPTTAAVALASLAPSSIFQLPGHGSAAFRFLARLVQTSPCFILELGSDVNGVAGAIEQLLARF